MPEIELKENKFKPGYYTLEGNYGGIGRAVYILVYTLAFAKKNPHRVNNSCLMLERFNTKPNIPVYQK